MKMKIMKKRSKDNNLLMLIDGSNLAYRSYYRFKQLRFKNVPTGLVFGFLRQLWIYITRFKPNDIIVIFDTAKSKKSNFRNKLHPNYKGDRKKDLSFNIEDFNHQIIIVRKVLRRLGIKVVWDNIGLKHETDDYIAYYTRAHTGKVVIISGDKDFCQLLDDNVKMLKVQSDKDNLLYKSNCKEVMGVEANQFADYLILVGDSSDSIKGYHGIGEVKGKKFFEQFKSINSFLRTESAEYPGIDKDGLRDLYKRNVYLINLDKALKKYPIKQIPLIKPKILNEDKVISMFEEYGMRHFTTNEFLEPFKQLQNENRNGRSIRRG